MANKKVKLNDKVNVKKNKKGVDIDKYVSDEAKEVRRFIIILLSIIILVLGVYAITRLVNKNKNSNNNRGNTFCHFFVWYNFNYLPIQSVKHPCKKAGENIFFALLDNTSSVKRKQESYNDSYSA